MTAQFQNILETTGRILIDRIMLPKATSKCCIYKVREKFVKYYDLKLLPDASARGTFFVVAA